MYNNIYMIDGLSSFTRLYYEDGHIEYASDDILNYVKDLKIGSGYKRPISIQNNILYPTSHSKDYENQYINIHYFDILNKDFIKLLENKNIKDKAISLYIKKKEKYFLEGNR